MQRVRYRLSPLLLGLELVKRPGKRLPGTAVVWFAWCNVRPTTRFTCESVQVERSIARTSRLLFSSSYSSPVWLGWICPSRPRARYVELRQRLGRAPLRALFDLLCGPATIAATHAAHWRGLLLTAVDGTTMSVGDADADAVRARYRKQRGAGYPALRLSVLLTCGTRSIIDAKFNPITTGELDQARTLTRRLRAGMLLVADRNYAADLLETLAATGADLLIRCKDGRRLPVIRRYRDGSWLADHL